MLDRATADADLFGDRELLTRFYRPLEPSADALGEQEGLAAGVTAGDHVPQLRQLGDVGRDHHGAAAASGR